MVDAEADGGEDPVAVLADRLAQADTRPKSAAGVAAEEPVDEQLDVLGRQAWLEDGAHGSLSV